MQNILQYIDSCHPKHTESERFYDIMRATEKGKLGTQWLYISVRDSSSEIYLLELCHLMLWIFYLTDIAKWKIEVTVWHVCNGFHRGSEMNMSVKRSCLWNHECCPQTKKNIRAILHHLHSRKKVVYCLHAKTCTFWHTE